MVCADGGVIIIYMITFVRLNPSLRMHYVYICFHCHGFWNSHAPIHSHMRWLYMHFAYSMMFVCMSKHEQLLWSLLWQLLSSHWPHVWGRVHPSTCLCFFPVVSDVRDHCDYAHANFPYISVCFLCYVWHDCNYILRRIGNKFILWKYVSILVVHYG